MTPQEKWDRLHSPKTVEDYGLFVTEEEMRTFPEGRKFLVGLRLFQRKRKNIERLMENAAVSAAQYIDALTIQIIKGSDKCQTQ